MITVENILDVIVVDYDIFSKRILEPSCGQGIFVLKLLTNIYSKFPDSLLVSNFISNNIFFIDVQEEMIEKTKSNIEKLYNFLFEEDFEGSFNGITWDFTDKIVSGNSLFEEIRITPFSELYNSFDYVVGNPPYAVKSVHTCPPSGTYCLSSMQIGHSTFSFCVELYCVPQVTQIILLFIIYFLSF